MTDRSEELLAAVEAAMHRGTPLRIVGNGSKSFLGRATEGEPLEVAGHGGVVDYEPTELVITVRAGTTLDAIEQVLAQQGQRLGSEPPTFDGRATVGGTLACNLSGPARPWAGSLRDHVLGVRLINGRGELLRFGGRVMKNVAGYDVARLQAGAYGGLGVLTEISLRVQPVPEAEETRALESDAGDAIGHMTEIGRRSAPLSGACWDGECLYLRFSGAAAAVTASAAAVGGDPVADAGIWGSLREFRHPQFADGLPVWRFSVPFAAALPRTDEAWLIDWGGAQRWLRSERPLADLERDAQAMGGQLSLFRGGDRRGEVVQACDPVRMKIHRSLKTAFDPQGIFNRGRLYGWL